METVDSDSSTWIRCLDIECASAEAITSFTLETNGFHSAAVKSLTSVTSFWIPPPRSAAGSWMQTGSPWLALGSR